MNEIELRMRDTTIKVCARDCFIHSDGCLKKKELKIQKNFLLIKVIIYIF